MGDRTGSFPGAGDMARTPGVVAGRRGRRVGTAVRHGVVRVSEVTREALLHAFAATG